MCTLASLYILRGKSVACQLYVAGFFYAYTFIICGSEPPCDVLMDSLPLRCKATGKAEPFFILSPQIKFLQMLYTENNLAVNEVQISYTPATNKPKITGSHSANEIFQQIWDPQLLHVQEQFYALFLNQANEVLCWRLIGTGTGKSCLVDNKLLATIVCKTLAHNVVLAHNHPSGNLKPSRADKTLTFKIEEMLKLFDVNIIDHLILGGNSFFSFVDNDLIFNPTN